MGAQGTGLGLDPTSELQLHRGMFSTWSPSDFTHAFTTHPRKYTCPPPRQDRAGGQERDQSQCLPNCFGHHRGWGGHTLACRGQGRAHQTVLRLGSRIREQHHRFWENRPGWVSWAPRANLIGRVWQAAVGRLQRGVEARPGPVVSSKDPMGFTYA